MNWVKEHTALSIIIALGIIGLIYWLMTKNKVSASNTNANPPIGFKPSVAPTGAAGSGGGNVIGGAGVSGVTTFSVPNPSMGNVNPINSAQAFSSCVSSAKIWNDIVNCMKANATAEDLQVNGGRLNKVSTVLNKIPSFNSQLINSISGSKTYAQVIDAYKSYYNNLSAVVTRANDPIFNSLAKSIVQSQAQLKAMSGGSGLNNIISTRQKDTLVNDVNNGITSYWRCVLNGVAGGFAGAARGGIGAAVTGGIIGGCVSAVGCLGASKPMPPTSIQINQ